MTREQLLRWDFLRNVLYVGAAGGAALAAILLALQLRWPETDLRLAAAVASGIPLTSAALLLWVRQYGRAASAGHLALAADLVLITTVSLLLGGVDSGVPVLYLWVVVAASLLFSGRAVPVYALASAVLAAGLAGLRAADLLSAPALPEPASIALRGGALVLASAMAGLGLYQLVRVQELLAAELKQLDQDLDRRVEAATLDLAEALREATALHGGVAAQLEDALRMRRLQDEMVHMLVHDLKSPLSNTITTLDILHDLAVAGEMGLGPAEIELLDNARLSAQQTERLIVNLLDIHRLEQRRFPVEITVVDLALTLQERCLQVAARVAQKRLSLETRTAADLPPARADRVLLARVVDNLLDNAIKYTPIGGHIRVTAELDEARIVLSVQDDGPGIPEIDRERVFERFERLSGDRTDFGIGLGLAFCRMAVEAQGGRIWVQPDATTGATFCVALERAA